MPMTTIVLVDDSPCDIMLFEAALEMSGIEADLTSFSNPDSALKYLHEGNQPDYLLLDLNMPGYDGFSVLGKLSGSTSYPRIVLSSSDSERDRERALALGASSYYTKPLHLEDLVTLITTVIAA